MMHRNLDRRVELLVRIRELSQQRRLRSLLELGMEDGTSSWWLKPDGYWARHSRDEFGRPQRDVQETLIRERRGRPVDEPALPPS
jgi:polyphosphate kinase